MTESNGDQRGEAIRNYRYYRMPRACASSQSE